jgi:hypothetical protein
VIDLKQNKVIATVDVLKKAGLTPNCIIELASQIRTVA